MVKSETYWKNLKTGEVWRVYNVNLTHVFIVHAQAGGVIRNLPYHKFLKKYKLDKAANILYGNEG